MVSGPLCNMIHRQLRISSIFSCSIMSIYLQVSYSCNHSVPTTSPYLHTGQLPCTESAIVDKSKTCVFVAMHSTWVVIVPAFTYLTSVDHNMFCRPGLTFRMHYTSCSVLQPHVETTTSDSQAIRPVVHWYMKHFHVVCIWCHRASCMIIRSARKHEAHMQKLYT